jgi:methyl-accepting chemotaxis protein
MNLTYFYQISGKVVMKKNYKLGTKLWGFTCLLLLAVLIVAGNSIWSIKNILFSGNQFSTASKHHAFLLEKEIDHLNWLGKVEDMFMDNGVTLDVQLDHTKCGLGKFLYGEEAVKLADSDPKLAALLSGIKEPHQHLHASGMAIKEVWRQRHDGLLIQLKNLLGGHQKWAAQVALIVIEQNPDREVQLDHQLCGLGKFLTSQEYENYADGFPELRQAMDAIKGPHQALHASAAEILASVKTGNYDRSIDVYKSETLPNLEQIQGHFQKAIEAEQAIETAQMEAHHILDTKGVTSIEATKKKLKALIDRMSEVQASSKEKMVSTGAIAQWSAILVTAIAAVMGIVIGFFFIRSITKPVRRIIEVLGTGAEQVASASSQVSSASQSLAEGASEQAASIEETSSSMEEMSAMTKQNADNAQQANAMMSEAQHIVEQANTSMGDLVSSMVEISNASEETSKIIKTIDEIAFQTNLLALNAAVEAARAGEAGSGFAVVADEVRNLAMRAADAAKDTAKLIESTVKKINAGSATVTQTNEAFTQVATSSLKVGDLVGEIAAASTEQAQGIEQVNTAISEMGRVTQQNAASAEESASASEEMSAQAEQMHAMVDRLTALVEGIRMSAKTTGSAKTLPVASSSKPSIGVGKSTLKPDSMIPFDNEDAFSDF